MLYSVQFKERLVLQRKDIHVLLTRSIITCSYCDVCSHQPCNNVNHDMHILFQNFGI